MLPKLDEIDCQGTLLIRHAMIFHIFKKWKVKDIGLKFSVFKGSFFLNIGFTCTLFGRTHYEMVEFM